MKVVLDEEKANKLLGYLTSRPYAEVFQFVAMIHQSVEKPEDDKVKPLPKKK